MVRAKDIMKTEVVTVSPETTVEDLGRLFIEKGISGAPVVGAAGDLYGIVTENDLIKQNRRFHIPTIIRLFDAFIPLGGSSAMEKEIKMMSASKVSDICSRDVITASPETPLTEIATIMTDKGIHLIPVVDGGRLLGIVGKMDVIKGSMGEAPE